MATAKTIVVTQIRGAARSPNKAKLMATLRGLGLGRVGKQRTLVDTPCVRGMLARVTGFVQVQA